MQYLAEENGLQEKTIAETLWNDYQRGNRPDVPGFLKKFGFEKTAAETIRASVPLPRQARHIQD